MNKAEWPALAERWLVDAKSLLADHRWSAAYYLAGYPVECGLEACVLGRLLATPEMIFEQRKFSENCWTHDLMELVKYAGLQATRAADAAANPLLGQNWLVVKEWKETSRYKTTTHQRAKKGYAAITAKPNGVMLLIRAR